MSKTIQTTRMDNDTMADDMSAGTTTDIRVMEEEFDSLGIVTYECVDPPSASHATRKVTGT